MCIRDRLATYTYETDAYLLAMLLACAAVWCSRRLPRLWGYAGAAVCLCGCLALYQSYIQFAVGLYLLLLLQSALQGAEWRPWLRQGVGALLTLALGAVLYVVSLKVSLALTGYQLADTGNGLAQMFRLGPAAVLAGIPATYGNFFKTLLGYSGWNDRGMRAATALLFVLAAGNLLHFVYDWTGQSPVVGALAAVNESVWEHMKLLTTPWVLWSIAELVAAGRSGLRVTAARAAGLLAGLAAIPMLFYTYQGVLGRDLMWLDIAIFQIAVLLGFWVSWTVLRRRALAAPLWQVAGGAVLAAVWAAFIVWTFAPPELPLFVDPETGLRGIR